MTGETPTDTPATADPERLEITASDQLHTWLAEHHGRDQSVWLVTWKAKHRDRYVSREQVLDELVAWGWIDGARKKVDDDRTMQLVSPRRTQYWARSYKVRAARLEAEGRMQPPGRASVEAGRANGLWTFIDDVDALIVPDDLAEALTSAGAHERFDALAPSYRRNVLRWLKLAKTAPTRAKRIAKVRDTVRDGQKIRHL